MAIENGVQNAELGYLLFPFEQYSNLAGKPLVGGHMEIFEAGTDTKYISYQNWDGAENPFKIPLPADGRITVLADPTKTFDCYLYDSYNNLVCSRLNVQANVPGNISIKGADTIIKNTDGTLDVSLRTLGNNIREYTVNTHNKVLDVQEPLYFVENSNTATVIGFSGDGYVSTSTYNTDITNITNNITALSSDVEGKMDVDKLEFENNKITGYDGSAFAGGGSVDPSEFVPWSASGAFAPSGNYYSASNPSGFINSDAISSMATTGFVADVSAEITGLIPTDLFTKASADTLYYPLNSNPSGYLTAHQDLSQYAKTEDLTAYQEKGDYYSASNPSGFLNKSSADELYAPTGDYATHDDLTAYQPTGDYAYASALDGKVDTSSFTAFSSTTNEHIEYLSAALSGSYELSAGEGIDITDYPNEQKTVISVTAQGGDPEVEQVVREYSAAGTWLTAHQDISNLMPKSESANFYPMTGNPSGFLTAVPNTYLQNTDLSAVDGKIVAISGIPLSAGSESNVTTENGSFTIAPNTAGIPVTITYQTASAPIEHEATILNSETTAQIPGGYFYASLVLSANDNGIKLTDDMIISVTYPDNAFSGGSFIRAQKANMNWTDVISSYGNYLGGIAQQSQALPSGTVSSRFINFDDSDYIKLVMTFPVFNGITTANITQADLYKAGQLTGYNVEIPAVPVLTFKTIGE